MRRIFNAHDLMVAKALLKSGMTQEAIAKEMGWSRSTIRRQLRENGVFSTRQHKYKYTPECVRAIERARLSGLTLEAAAKAAGISDTTFYAWRRAGLVKSPILKCTDKDPEKYRRIYVRYKKGDESPQDLAMIYGISVEALLAAWRRMGLPLDMQRSIARRAQTIRRRKKRPDNGALGEQWQLYSADIINAQTAMAHLGMSWARLRSVWRDMGYPVEVVAARHMRESRRNFDKRRASRLMGG